MGWFLILNMTKVGEASWYSYPTFDCYPFRLCRPSFQMMACLIIGFLSGWTWITTRRDFSFKKCSHRAQTGSRPTWSVSWFRGQQLMMIRNDHLFWLETDIKNWAFFFSCSTTWRHHINHLRASWRGWTRLTAGASGPFWRFDDLCQGGKSQSTCDYPAMRTAVRLEWHFSGSTKTIQNLLYHTVFGGMHIHLPFLWEFTYQSFDP